MPITDTTDTTAPSAPPVEGWCEAGEAWSHAARDWAYLFEPYGRDAAEHIFRALDVGPSTDLLDLACGSAYATARAARLGARTAGIDASEALIAIAQERDPDGDYRVGDMFALPYPDESFDVVTSFNGIWGGCDAAIAEAHRILRPGGTIAITFWGPGNALDYRDWFIAIGSTTDDTKDEMIGLASIGAPGVAEAMFVRAGLAVTERGSTIAIHEFVDDDHAWRTLRSPGLVLPALHALGDDGLRALLLPTIEPFRASDGSYRVRNELTHVIGIKPTA